MTHQDTDFSDKEEKIESIEKIINYKFNNKNLLEEALSHPSLKQISLDHKNYEKLEFLGDSVLGFVITDLIYNMYNQKFSEGDMAKMKAHLVSKDVVQKIAFDINLDKSIIMTRGEELSGGRDNINNLENAMEALIGAIYLDGSIKDAYGFISKYWSIYVKKTNIDNLDPKTHLQEIAYHINKSLPKYEVIDKIGMQHHPIFKVKCTVMDFEVIEDGNNIKQAEKSAAEKMIEIIEKQKNNI